MTTYTNHEQRILDQQSGIGLDRLAARRRMLADPTFYPHYELRIIPTVRDTWKFQIVRDGSHVCWEGTCFRSREECRRKGEKALRICERGAELERSGYITHGMK